MNIKSFNEVISRIFVTVIDRYALEYAYDSGDIILFNEFVGSVSERSSGIIVHPGNSAGEHLIGPAERASPRNRP
jgi:hypothetical protein